MGNSNNANSKKGQQATWLVVNNKYDLTLIDKKALNEVEKTYKKIHGSKNKLFVPDYKEKNKPTAASKRSNLRNMRIKKYDDDSWDYYRDIASKAVQHPQIENIPNDQYFIFAQYLQDTISNNIIPEKLRKSLLNNLNKLSLDDTVKYDLRDANKGHYLYHKTMRFGVAKPRKELQSVNAELWPEG